MTFDNNLKTSLIVNKLIEVNYYVLKAYTNITVSIDILSYYKTYVHEMLIIVLKFITNNKVRSDNFDNIQCISIYNMFDLFSKNKLDYIEFGAKIYYHLFKYNKKVPSDSNLNELNWSNLFCVILYVNHTDRVKSNVDLIDRIKYNIYTNIYLKYDKTIKQIINNKLYKNTSILTDLQYNIVLTKLIQFNIKLKEELIDGAQNTHIYNYILRKMSNFANLIDFGYSFKINKKNIFNNTYISLNQIYDLFMINTEEDKEDFKIFLIESSIYLDSQLVAVDQHIFSWNQLLKIINRYTNIDSISEKKYMKYLHQMYTECILEILDEIR